MLKIANAEGIKRLGDELIKVTDRKNYVRFRELDDYFLVPIRKIEWSNFNGKVYNLTVEDDHSYVANFLTAKNCMPEITVRPILEKIHQESGIPFLSLSLDEQVAEAGINTRLEAFIDVVKSYHNKKIIPIYE
jgi:predicted nucleotide-binding protein (sugar kinase/HSP70/actin superfamily)